MEHPRENEAVLESGRWRIHFRPRESWSWDEFQTRAPRYSIALDGMVRGGPKFDLTAWHSYVNFDHHDGVIREVTMSTAMQVYFAIKGGMFEAFKKAPHIHVFVNDTDQDTSLAVWLFLHHAEFEGTKSIPHINRLLALDDRLDITGGAFPMLLDDELLHKHGWVFQPYTDLRKSGALARATAIELCDNFEAVAKRLNMFMMGESGSVPLDTRSTILFEHPAFLVYDEIGGSDARYALYSKGMNAFVAIVARRPDGRMVCTVGKRSLWIRAFDLPRIYDALNAEEGLTLANGWNGSSIIGGSSRSMGTGLSIERIRDVVLSTIKED